MTRLWAKHGSRPRGLRDRRFKNWAYLFGAVCPARGVGAALVMPTVDADAMNKHLAEISKCVVPGAIAVRVIDGAGWHRAVAAGRKLAIGHHVRIAFLMNRWYGTKTKLGKDGAQNMAMDILRRVASALLLTFVACLVGWAAAASEPPGKILVVDATASPGIVQLDTSLGVEAQRAAAGVTPEQAAAQDVLAVQSALSDTLVKKIQAMGLQAERVPAGTLPGPGELAVTMQITSIQEGNRARRTVIGFGAGKVSVRGNATLLRKTSAGLEVLETYSTSADSGRMPGMGIGAASGGAKSAATVISGAAHGTAELENSPVAEEATKVANRFSTSLGQYFAAQAWIAPSAIP